MKKIGGAWAFISLVLFASALVWLFVWEQRELVASPKIFFSLIGILLLFSFWTSATEAAFAVVSSLGDPPALTAKIDAEVKTMNQLAADEQKTRESPEHLQKQLRFVIKLRRRQRTLTTSSRDSYVGAFACASVFLNTALVAFIPAALVSNATTTTHLKKILDSYLNPDWHAYLSGNKWLTFVSTTFLLLIFGKIVPKMVGFAFPYLFTYRLGRLADIVHFLFGWIARGTKFPLTKLLKEDDDSRRRFGN